MDGLSAVPAPGQGTEGCQPCHRSVGWGWAMCLQGRGDVGPARGSLWWGLV